MLKGILKKEYDKQIKKNVTWSKKELKQIKYYNPNENVNVKEMFVDSINTETSCTRSGKIFRR